MDDKRPTWQDLHKSGSSVIVRDPNAQPNSSVMQMGAPPRVVQVTVTDIMEDYVEIVYDTGSHRGQIDWFHQDYLQVMEILED